MRVLGFDPGLVYMGFGVVDFEEGETISIAHLGYFHIPRNGQTFNEYLNGAIAALTENFPRLLQNYEPNMVASEIVPVGKLGSNTELVVAGITTIKTICFQFGIEWKDIAANTVKKIMTGDGRATKATVQSTLCSLYPSLKKKHLEIKGEQKVKGEKAQGLPPDVFDGLAVALATASQLGGVLKEGEMLGDSILGEAQDSEGGL